jgi:hypothetical protein
VTNVASLHHVNHRLGQIRRVVTDPLNRLGDDRQVDAGAVGVS